MNIVITVLQYIINFSAPLLLVALGGMYAQRSGVLNVSYEGSMIAGALVGTCVIHFIGQIMPAQTVFIIAILSSLIAGGVYAYFHALVCLGRDSDQQLAGMSLNIVSGAIALYIIASFSVNSAIDISDIFKVESVPFLCDIPVIGELLFKNSYFTTYISVILLVVSSVLLYKTKFGLRLRSCGENPVAAAAAGLKVRKYRYSAELIAGMLSAVGGLTLIITAYSSFEGTVGGFGYMAIVILIIARWKPFWVFMTSLFFGLTASLLSLSAKLGILEKTDDLLSIVPFVVALALLAFFNRSAKKPRALGTYFPDEKDE